MSMLRAFIAIEIPDEIQEAIFQKTAKIRLNLDRSIVRWVPTQNVHLTLKFLGDISPANLEILMQMLKPEVGQHQPFTIDIGGLGSFPNPRRARVIWIGIQAPAGLDSLQRSIDTAAARLGYAIEARSFSPHLTIGRVNRHISSTEQQQIRIALEETQVGSLGAARVEAVTLFRSDLQPNGAVYTPLFTTPLG